MLHTLASPQHYTHHHELHKFISHTFLCLQCYQALLSGSPAPPLQTHNNIMYFVLLHVATLVYMYRKWIGCCSLAQCNYVCSNNNYGFEAKVGRLTFTGGA